MVHPFYKKVGLQTSRTCVGFKKQEFQCVDPFTIPKPKGGGLASEKLPTFCTARSFLQGSAVLKRCPALLGQFLGLSIPISPNEDSTTPQGSLPLWSKAFFSRMDHTFLKGESWPLGHLSEGSNRASFDYGYLDHWPLRHWFLWPLCWSVVTTGLQQPFTSHFPGSPLPPTIRTGITTNPLFLSWICGQTPLCGP